MKNLTLISNLTTALLTLLIGSITSIALPSASAASSDPKIEKTPLPAGPLVRNMPDPSAWRISYVYDSEKKTPSSSTPAPLPAARVETIMDQAIRSIIVNKAGESWRVITEDVKGRTFEYFGIAKSRFLVDSKSPQASPLTPSDENGNSVLGLKSFEDGKFPDLEWVTPDTYLGIQKFQEIDYLVFGSQDGSRVWVNAKTRFPAMLKTPNATVTFKRLPNPAGALPMPPQVQAIMDASKKDLEIFTRPRSPGG